MATWKEKFNKKYNHKKDASHSLSDVSKETGVSKKGLQQIYNKGIGAYKTNPQSVRPNVTSKEQWAMARVYSSVMGGKASKVDAKELKMEMGGEVPLLTGSLEERRKKFSELKLKFKKDGRGYYSSSINVDGNNWKWLIEGSKKYWLYTVEKNGNNIHDDGGVSVKKDWIDSANNDYWQILNGEHPYEEYSNGGQIQINMAKGDNIEEINWSEYYKEGGLTETSMSKEMQDRLFDSKGNRKIDLESIKVLTDYVNSLPQTKSMHFNKSTQRYSPTRQKLHREILQEFKDKLVCIESDEPIAILMGGSPASGKSTFLRKYAPYLLSEELLRIDADEVRSKLPEYEGWNASQTHIETKDIVNTLLSDKTIGMPCKTDVIYDGTMNSTKSYLPLIALLKKLGYKIFVVYIDNVPKDKIVKRALERYGKSGRFVPLEVIDDFFGKGKVALNEIKQKVDGYMIIDGSSSDYAIIEEGGFKLPRNRAYSEIGYPTKKVERGNFEKGGQTDFNPDGKIKNKIVHASGDAGGMLVGKRHSEGGIKALNQSTGQPLEMEGGEVVITRNAVSDNKKRSFNGKMLTNRQILSSINESGGGVSFADGGEVPNDLKFDCNAEYEYGGKTMCGKDLAYAMGGVTTAIVTDPNEAMADLQSTYGFGDVYANGGEIKKINAILEKIEDGQRFALSRYHTARKLKDGSYEISTIPKKEDEGDLSKGYRTKNYTDYTKFKNSVIRNLKSPTSRIDSKFEKGGTIECGSCSWSWDRKDGGNDMYVCHKCGTDNTSKYEKGGAVSLHDEVDALVGSLDATSFASGGMVKTEVTNADLKKLIGQYVEVKEGSTKGLISKAEKSVDEYYLELYALDKYWGGSRISEAELLSFINGGSMTDNDGTVWKRYKPEYTLMQSKFMSDVIIKYKGDLLNSDRLIKIAKDVFSPIGDVVRKISVTDRGEEPQVFTSFNELYKQYILKNPSTRRYGRELDFRINDDDRIYTLRYGKVKVIKRNDKAYWRIGSGAKIPPYYDVALSIWGNSGRLQFEQSFNFEKFFDQKASGLNDLEKQEKKAIEDLIKLGYKVVPLVDKRIKNTYSLDFVDTETGNVVEVLVDDENKRILLSDFTNTSRRQFLRWQEFGFISKKLKIEDVKVLEPLIDFSSQKNYLKARIKSLGTELELKKVALSNEEIAFYLREIKRFTFMLRELSQQDLAQTDSIKSRLLKAYDSDWGSMDNKYTPCKIPSINGKPSQLTDSEFLRVQTENFKLFFGDWQEAYGTGNYTNVSKVINEKTKEPLAVYHGTNVLFTNWKTYETNNAHYFAVKRKMSEFFATSWDSRGDKAGVDSQMIKKLNPNTGEFIYRCFLDIKNPIDFSRFGVEKRPIRDFLDFLRVNYNIYDFDFWSNINTLDKRSLETKMYAWQIIRHWQKFTEYIRLYTTYDGYVFYEFIPDSNKQTIDDASLSYCTFDSNQVKFANSSEFNALNVDSRFEQGGKIN